MTRPLRVCLVSEEYPPETGWGGIGTYTYNLARGLADKGHLVSVIARTWDEESRHEDDGVIVRRLAVSEPSWKRGTQRVVAALHESRSIVLWNLKVAKAVRQLTATEGLDVIEVPEYRAQALIAASARPPAPVVVRLHTPAYLDRQVTGVAVGGSRVDTALSERAEALLARRAALVTAPSSALANEVASSWGMDPSAVRVVPNPIDDRRFAPNGTERRDDVVLYVGRISRRKGVTTLAEAVPGLVDEFPGLRVRFVGGDHSSGPDGTSMTQHLRSKLAAHPVASDAVEFAGSAEWSALAPVYGEAAICVVPSLYESFSYTCVEAMASGCALVASAVGAIPEVVRDGVDGLLVPPGDAAALRAAIARLLRDRDLRSRLGANARRSVEQRFASEAVCAAMAATYGEVAP